MKRNSYKTKQRELILDAIRSFDGGHFTVAEVMLRLSSSGAGIAQSTVYRELDRLLGSGEINRFETGGQGKACYQLSSAEDCRSHFHLRCTECGELIHMDCDFMTSLAQHVKESHGFEIDPSRTVFYGLCSKCERRRLNEEN